jgi:hypothetical protein
MPDKSPTSAREDPGSGDQRKNKDRALGQVRLVSNPASLYRVYLSFHDG